MPTEALAFLFTLHRELQAVTVDALRDVAAGTGSLGMAALLGIALGALHALTPGHGKAVIVSYFLGREARLWAGVAAGLRVAGGHVLLAAALVLGFGATVSFLGRPAGAAAHVQIFAYTVIAASGAWLLYRSLHPSRKEGDGMASPHGHQTHRHFLPGLAGLIPCPLTMLLLSFTIAKGSLAAGAVIAAALGLGIAATITTFGVAAILARRLLSASFSLQSGYGPKLARGIEMLSAAAIFLIGVKLLAEALF